MEFLASDPDLLFQLGKESFVVLADGFHQARNQQFARWLRHVQEAGHEVVGALVLPLAAREARRIEKGALEFAAVQDAFLEKPVERGHYGSVGEGTAQAANHVVDVALATQPENFQNGDFERSHIKHPYFMAADLLG